MINTISSFSVVLGICNPNKSICLNIIPIRYWCTMNKPSNMVSKGTPNFSYFSSIAFKIRLYSFYLFRIHEKIEKEIRSF